MLVLLIGRGCGHFERRRLVKWAGLSRIATYPNNKIVLKIPNATHRKPINLEIVAPAYNHGVVGHEPPPGIA